MLFKVEIIFFIIRKFSPKKFKKAKRNKTPKTTARIAGRNGTLNQSKENINMSKMARKISNFNIAKNLA